MTFIPLALVQRQGFAIDCVAIPKMQPTGQERGPTAGCGRVLEVDEFTVSRQLST